MLCSSIVPPWETEPGKCARRAVIEVSAARHRCSLRRDRCRRDFLAAPHPDPPGPTTGPATRDGSFRLGPESGHAAPSNGGKLARGFQRWSPCDGKPCIKPPPERCRSRTAVHGLLFTDWRTRKRWAHPRRACFCCALPRLSRSGFMARVRKI